MKTLLRTLLLTFLLCANALGADKRLPGWGNGYRALTKATLPEFALTKETKMRDALSELSAAAAKHDSAFSTILRAGVGDIAIPELKYENASVHQIIVNIANLSDRPVSVTYEKFGLCVGSEKKPATLIIGKLYPGIKIKGWPMNAVSIFGPITQKAVNSKTREFQYLCERDKASRILDFLIETGWVADYTKVELDWPPDLNAALPSTLLKESPFGPKKDE